MRTAIVFIVAVALPIAMPVAAQPTGELVGCITDAVKQPMPRVTVVLRSSRVEQTISADDGGCYKAPALPPDVYRITARLLGFDNETREKIRIEPGRIARVDFHMQVSAVCECLAPPTTLRERAERADAVMHLRITDHATQLPAPPGFFAHTAEVLEVLKPHAGTPSTERAVTFLQSQASGEPDPYDPGDGFVMFLRWSRPLRTFVIPAHSAWTVLRIQNDEIIGSAMRADELLAQLRALSTEK